MLTRFTCGLSIFFATVVMVGQQDTINPKIATPQRTPQEVLLLLSGESAIDRILLTLNNNRASPLEAGMVVYTAAGQVVQLPSVRMIAGESRTVELSPILQNSGLESEELGWIKLTYDGMIMEMGSQLTLYPLGRLCTSSATTA